MKPPTKRELQRLAVEALGEGATVHVEDHRHSELAWASSRDLSGNQVSVWNARGHGRVALAAALQALAEVKHGD